MNDWRSARSISRQHDAITVVMVRMRTAGSPATAARRMCDDVHTIRQTSTKSAMNGKGAKVGGARTDAPTVLRGEASEGACGGLMA